MRRLVSSVRWEVLPGGEWKREGYILVDFTQQENFWFAGRHCVGRLWMGVMVETGR